MENKRTQRWLLISFFTALGLIFVYFIFTIVMGKTDDVYNQRLAAARNGPGSYFKDHRVNLMLDQPVILKKIKMTYRGISSGVLKLDIILLDLDPEYVYSRLIPIDKAKMGFTVSDYRLRATSVSTQRLRMVLGDG
jgi:hypothetical protein